MRSLRIEDYADDEQVRVLHAEREVWLSERLFRRLVLIGAAYELHLLPLLGEDATLNAVQADALAAELDFVGALVADPALASVLNALAPLVSACRAAKGELRIDWP